MHFIDLETQQSLIRNKIEMRIQDVLNHGRYILGPKVTELEEKLADYVADRIFSLPMHPFLETKDQNKIIKILNNV
jgi:dTDP-4-amino-4,6-dideoxygalactose transaminase